jgi:hypothetical protein
MFRFVAAFRPPQGTKRTWAIFIQKKVEKIEEI